MSREKGTHQYLVYEDSVAFYGERESWEDDLKWHEFLKWWVETGLVDMWG